MAFDDLDDLYQEVILDHYRTPRNHRRLEKYDIHAKGFNPFCGDEVILEAKLDDQGRVSEVGFDGRGCSISLASASIMTESLKGKTLEEIDALTSLFKGMMRGEDISEESRKELEELKALEGVKKYPVRIKCALLPWAALRDGIEEYQSKT